MKPKKGLLKISRLAEKAGVTVPTVKHYLREGLLPRPVKTSRNMAYYSETCIERIKLVKKLQKEKFLPLDVIKRLIDSGESFDEELALGKAILKTDRISTRKRPVARSRIETTTGYPLDKIDILEENGLVHPETAGDTKIYHPDDIELIHIMKTREALGLPVDLSLATLSIYGDAITHAVGEDINFFVRNIMGDLPTRQAIRLITEADETLDRFIISFRHKMLRHFSAKTIKSLNRLRDDLTLLNILPVDGSQLPGHPPDTPFDNLIYHLLKGDGQMPGDESGPTVPADNDRDLRAIHIFSQLMCGQTDKALAGVEAAFPKPSFHALENTVAALVHLFSMDSTSGLSAPMFGIKRVFAHLKRIEQLHRQDPLFEIFPRYVCGAVYIFLPGVFNTRDTGIDMLLQLREYLGEIEIDKAPFPGWLTRTLAYEIIPALNLRINRFLALGYLKNGNTAQAAAYLNTLVDLADPDSEHAAWARLERTRHAR